MIGGFEALPLEGPLERVITEGIGTSVFRIWKDSFSSDNLRESTTYGYASRSMTLLCDYGTFQLVEGMYFCMPGRFEVRGECGILCTRMDFKGIFTIGGPTEYNGRLRYIDGCSDTVLLNPTVKGNPCFNFLHIPAGIDQTAHTHPTVRLGLIIEGRGLCRTSDGEFVLKPGISFVLRSDEIHSFHTTDDYLRLVIYHPDSDTGPSHDDHPMVNRTVVNGVSASKIEEIRTRELPQRAPSVGEKISPVSN